MFSKILNKLKSVFGKKSISKTSKPKKVSKTKNTSKTAKSSKSSKSTKSTKPARGKKQEVKLLIESFTSIPGVGAKSAKAFYDAGFKSKKDILSAKDEDLLAVPGVGINLVKKLKDYKP
tara:strand:+ start:138 stop:494 length:357 start_codon:yes stop_codon:yes gene_type:complete